MTYPTGFCCCSIGTCCSICWVFSAFLRICSYHADGQLHHDTVEVLVDIKAADFRVISASIRHQRPAEELGLKCSPQAWQGAHAGSHVVFLLLRQKEEFSISSRGVTRMSMQFRSCSVSPLPGWLCTVVAGGEFPRTASIEVYIARK